MIRGHLWRKEIWIPPRWHSYYKLQIGLFLHRWCRPVWRLIKSRPA
jgi:hypothetical protein